ncbi:hypothetical protein BDV98DRAFT_556819 [Pterulicium gracile]|uniref:Complex I-B15 n=1 Tax=Pterulicium gracile TaxID=1884261 RepID=A0A5C3R1X7_9AGAR|nr:hypothetical protein BDV98DRAFT_556819 [Pterula gracilis]
MGALKLDPAVENFDRVRESSYKTYRFTRRTVISAFIGGVLLPATVYILSEATDRRHNWVARLRSEPLTRPLEESNS